jgi:hypothetical protein
MEPAAATIGTRYPMLATVAADASSAALIARLSDRG